jgi:hypothetical protein
LGVSRSSPSRALTRPCGLSCCRESGWWRFESHLPSPLHSLYHHHPVAAPRGSAAEGRLVKNLQPPLPGPAPDRAPQELRFVIKTPLRLGGLSYLSYEAVVISDLAFYRACLGGTASSTVRVLSGTGVRPPRAVALASPHFLPPRLVRCRAETRGPALATPMRVTGLISRTGSTTRAAGPRQVWLPLQQAVLVAHMRGVC